MEKFYKKYKKKATFYIVYIREAHPSDGRSPIKNAPKDPKSIDERDILASKCIKEMKLTLPCLVDNMKDEANKGYSAWPDRIYIVNVEQKIHYKAGRGPWGFKPDEAEKSLKELLEKKKEKK